MEMKMLYWVMACVILLQFPQVYGQDQSGFISIDCGASEDYTDRTTGIAYISDRPENIDSGENQNIDQAYMTESLLQQLANVRTFPSGVKNCYSIRTPYGKDNNYLIRAIFMYGNYDSKNQLPEFKLLLGVNDWNNITFRNVSEIVVRELIHVPNTDYIHVCLLKTGSSTPFISALELRHLNNSIYRANSGSLSPSLRFDLGSTTNSTVRYRDDAYDRLWQPYNAQGWEKIRAAYDSDLSSGSGYKLPPTVMRTAMVPANGSKTMRFRWTPHDPRQPFYMFLHFAEVNNSGANQFRNFSITVNGGQWYDSVVISQYMSPLTVFSTYALSGEVLEFSMTMNQGSTLPPILNAMEIYANVEFLQSPTIQPEVDAMEKIKSVYAVKRIWQGDPCAPRNFSWDGVGCRYDGFNSPHITSLNLSSCELQGSIDPSFSNLTSLIDLDLSYNSLSGQIPEFLSELTSLRTLNLSGNKFTGSVPTILMDRLNLGTLNLSVDGNPDLCFPNPCKKRKTNVIVPVVASVASLLVTLGALVVLWCLKRKKQYGFVFKPKKEVRTMESRGRQFTYSELRAMTNDFQKVIGKGGFGSVYMGQLKDGTLVAVKMLSTTSKQGSKQFQTEAELLTRVHHRNLALLIGFCDEGLHLGLIYEFMANGNLQEYLSDADGNGIVLTWEQRVQIALDTAQALEYLHYGCKPPIIHRDVKTANILLNEKFQAKVADFGLSRIVPLESGTHVSTAVVGTRGYLDPEYYISNHLNEKSDVYSFGIVLLELISGQPAIIKSNNESTHIVQWANRILARGEIRDIVDGRLQGDFDINSAWKAVEIAMACVPSSAIQRPTMSQVVVELKECMDVEMANRSNSRVNNYSWTSGSSVEMVSLDIETSSGPQAR